MEPELRIKEIKRSKQSKKNVESKLRRMKRKNKSSAGSGSLLNAQPQNLLEIEGVICGELGSKLFDCLIDFIQEDSCQFSMITGGTIFTPDPLSQNRRQMSVWVFKRQLLPDSSCELAIPQVFLHYALIKGIQLPDKFVQEEIFLSVVGDQHSLSDSSLMRFSLISDSVRSQILSRLSPAAAATEQAAEDNCKGGTGSPADLEAAEHEGYWKRSRSKAAAAGGTVKAIPTFRLSDDDKHRRYNLNKSRLGDDDDGLVFPHRAAPVVDMGFKMPDSEGGGDNDDDAGEAVGAGKDELSPLPPPLGGACANSLESSVTSLTPPPIHALSILGVDGLRNQYCAAADSLTVKPPWTDNGVRRGCTIEHGLPADKPIIGDSNLNARKKKNQFDGTLPLGEDSKSAYLELMVLATAIVNSMDDYIQESSKQSDFSESVWNQHKVAAQELKTKAAGFKIRVKTEGFLMSTSLLGSFRLEVSEIKTLSVIIQNPVGQSDADRVDDSHVVVPLQIDEEASLESYARTIQREVHFVHGIDSCLEEVLILSMKLSAFEIQADICLAAIKECVASSAFKPASGQEKAGKAALVGGFYLSNIASVMGCCIKLLTLAHNHAPTSEDNVINEQGVRLAVYNPDPHAVSKLLLRNTLPLGAARTLSTIHLGYFESSRKFALLIDKTEDLLLQSQGTAFKAEMRRKLLVLCSTMRGKMCSKQMDGYVEVIPGISKMGNLFAFLVQKDTVPAILSEICRLAHRLAYCETSLLNSAMGMFCASLSLSKYFLGPLLVMSCAVVRQSARRTSVAYANAVSTDFAHSMTVSTLLQWQSLQDQDREFQFCLTAAASLITCSPMHDSIEVLTSLQWDIELQSMAGSNSASKNKRQLLPWIREVCSFVIVVLETARKLHTKKRRAGVKEVLSAATRQFTSMNHCLQLTALLHKFESAEPMDIPPHVLPLFDAMSALLKANLSLSGQNPGLYASLDEFLTSGSDIARFIAGMVLGALYGLSSLTNDKKYCIRTETVLPVKNGHAYVLAALLATQHPIFTSLSVVDKEKGIEMFVGRQSHSDTTQGGEKSSSCPSSAKQEVVAPEHLRSIVTMRPVWFLNSSDSPGIEFTLDTRVGVFTSFKIIASSGNTLFATVKKMLLLAGSLRMQSSLALMHNKNKTYCKKAIAEHIKRMQVSSLKNTLWGNCIQSDLLDPETTTPQSVLSKYSKQYIEDMACESCPGSFWELYGLSKALKFSYFVWKIVEGKGQYVCHRKTEGAEYQKVLHICWSFDGKHEHWSPTDLPALFTPWGLGPHINSNTEVCAMTVTVLVKPVTSTAFVYPAGGTQLVVTLQDKITADGKNWLNDVVVDFLLCKVRERLSLQGVPDGSIHIFSSFFFTQLTLSGHHGVARWSELCSTVFASEFLFIMINEDRMHWVCVLVHNPAGIELLCRCSAGSEAMLGPRLSLLFMNSQKNGSKLGDERAELILSFLVQEWNAKHPNTELLVLDKLLPTVTVHNLDVPLQDNCHDCALFAVNCLEYFIKDFIVGKKIPFVDQPWLSLVNQLWFSQSDISQKRLDLCNLMKLYSEKFEGESGLAAAMKLSTNTAPKHAKAKLSLPAGDAASGVYVGLAASRACSSSAGDKRKADNVPSCSQPACKRNFSPLDTRKLTLQSKRSKWVSKVLQGTIMTATARAVSKSDANCSASLPLHLQLTDTGQLTVESDPAHRKCHALKKQKLVGTGHQSQDRKQQPKPNYGKGWNAGTARDACNLSMLRAVGKLVPPGLGCGKKRLENLAKSIRNGEPIDAVCVKSPSLKRSWMDSVLADLVNSCYGAFSKVTRLDLQGTQLGAEGKFRKTWLQVLELIKGMRAPSQLPMQLIGLKDTHLQNSDLLLLAAALDSLAVHPEGSVVPEILELQEILFSSSTKRSLLASANRAGVRILF